MSLINFKKQNLRIFILVFILILLGVVVFEIRTRAKNKSNQTSSVSTSHNQPLHPVLQNFDYNFSTTDTLNEAGSFRESTSPYWWLNSGGKLLLKGGVGETIQGDLSTNDKWYKEYKRANSLDTDGGLHPQNLFRLITKSVWHNFSEQAYFKITKDNLSASPNRNESNGLLLFNRYKDSQNLYYAGIRVDGTAVIKKKQKSLYTTLAQKQIFDGTYNPETSPNLLPKNTWIGLRTETVTESDGVVDIKLYTDVGKTGKWTLVLEAKDNGEDYGPIIDDTAPAGIRTDFMDVLFDDFQITKL